MMKRSQQGFTVIELITYLAIFLVVSIAAISLLLSLDKFVDRYRVETALYRTGTNIMEQIMVEVRKSDQFDATNSVLETEGTGVLALLNGTDTTQFTKSGSTLTLTKNGTSYGALNTADATVTGFTVYRYVGASGTIVRVHLELTATNGEFTKQLDLYGGAIIRGSL